MLPPFQRECSEALRKVCVLPHHLTASQPNDHDLNFMVVKTSNLTLQISAHHLSKLTRLSRSGENIFQATIITFYYNAYHMSRCKGKVVPVLFLTEHHAIMAYWGSGSVTPCIL
jgi:hypothetical protein